MKKYRIDCRFSKRGKITYSIWCDNLDLSKLPHPFIDIYELKGMRYIKIKSIEPNSK